MLPILFLLACGSPEPEAPPAPPEPTQEEPPKPRSATTPEEAEAVGLADRAVAALGKTLKGELMGAMKEGGPVAAIDVCNTKASGLTDKVGEDMGVSIGRTSLKLRNPENAKDWVRPWLEKHDGMGAAKPMGTEERVGDTLRVIRPIGVEGPCLACHGPSENLSAEVKALLAEKYPEDQATGYAVGDLRGAFWVEVPVGG